MKFWTWLLSWFRRKPDAVVENPYLAPENFQVEAKRIADEVDSEALMELMKPIRMGKPQTYGEIERQRSRVKHPRRH